MPDSDTGTENTPQSPGPRPQQPLRVRVVQLVFLGIAVIATLCLAWWQWGRWTSGDGSYQNLGYALQWPFFGLFFIFAYRKYMEYERERAAGAVAPAAPVPTSDDEAREIPEDILPQRPAPTDDSDPFVDDRRRRARAHHNTDSKPDSRPDKDGTDRR